MRVLITGGAGNLGRYVIEEMRGYYELVIFDIKEPENKDFKFIRGDILDIHSLERALKGIDVVVHLAAIPHPLSEPAERVFNVNAMGTFNVLEAASKCKVKRVVMASSDSTLGFVFRVNDSLAPEYFPIDEAHPCKPEDPYGLSKLVGEEICEAYTRRTGIETVCLRICFVWFPHLKENYRPLFEEPDTWWKTLWVYEDARDAALAFRLAVEKEELRHERMFICADDNGTKEQSLELIRKYYPKVKRVDEERLKGRASLVSNEKAKRVLGFYPKYSWKDLFEEGSNIEQSTG
ncbi:NAD(P)-dependent oxidoreductase [bacterium]|nr:NAD(P)-dependent oxidoreductase [bacterium]